MNISQRRLPLPAALGLAAFWMVHPALIDPSPAQTKRSKTPIKPRPTSRPLPDVADMREPYDPQRASKTVAFWEARVKADAQGAIALRELAAAYLARGRETGDIADAVRAERAARRSLEILPGRRNLSALLRLTRALLTQHRFPEALAIADRAAALDPDAQRLRVDILLELGEHAAAERALSQIPASPGDPQRKEDLNYKALRARILEGKGQWRAALALMTEAARQAEQLVDMPAESAAWYHTMIGHALIDRGRLEEGERRCRRALQIFPRDYRAMTGLAEAAAWRGDWNRAIAWGQKSIAIAPQNPEVLQLLGDAYAAQGKTAQAARQYALLKKLAYSFPRIYDRNWAMFLADQKRDLKEALAIARRDLQLRQDAGAYETLAWVSYKAGLLPQARANMEKALKRTGPRDANFYYHAAMIARAAGETARARTFLAQAHASNPYLLKSMNMTAPKMAALKS